MKTARIRCALALAFLVCAAALIPGLAIAETTQMRLVVGGDALEYVGGYAAGTRLFGGHQIWRGRI